MNDTINWKELLKQPNGIIFYEDDLPEMPLFRKLETLQDDVIVEGIATTEQCRLGLREMDECDRNSKRYKIWQGTITTWTEHGWPEVIETK